ncbi:NACHT domain-containing protein [Actinomadura soli]|uniref:NACHT domain-containing protein n=1 Tax=Actinomadura soli TaxID=2508997 RepID=UPI001486230C|nr:hypothetical protein [Actinomadura soli]
MVFDGLDEIFEPKRRNAVARQIDWFAKSHPRARVVVTSRVIGYDRTVFDRAGFTTLMLQDLTREQITQFTTTWFDRSCAGRPADAVRLRKRILGAVKDSPVVAELAGNPMLLTILAIIARRRELPRDRRSVYEHAVMLLIDQWDVNKELADQHTDLPRLEARDKLRMLHTVAQRMQDGPAGLAGNHLHGDELIQLFQDYFTGRLGLPLDRAVQAARTMLQQLRDRNFILASYGAELYGFVHRAFLEYLAADDINQRFTNRVLTEQELLAIYDTRWNDPAWTEVLVLLAGLIPEQFAVAAITRLLDADPAWRARDRPPRHLLLALSIAGEFDHRPVLATHSRTITLVVIEVLKAIRRREPPINRTGATLSKLRSRLSSRTRPARDGSTMAYTSAGTTPSWVGPYSSLLTAVTLRRKLKTPADFIAPPSTTSTYSFDEPQYRRWVRVGQVIRKR